MKGIVLAGGSGSRLSPLTDVLSKQMLPIYDKPMIFYPIQTLYDSGIREILIISNPEYIGIFESLLSISYFEGLEFKFAVQQRPEGIPQALSIGREFIGDDNIALILGDNVFLNHDFREIIFEKDNLKSAKIFGLKVNDPHRFGVAEVDENGGLVNIHEKPSEPISDIAVVGLYLYPNDAIEKVKYLKRSDRGEFEITDLNMEFLKENRLDLAILPEHTQWVDTGTFDSLLDAGNLVRDTKNRM